MFTGLIEEIGIVNAIIPNANGIQLVIDAPDIAKESAIGDSISVNGCCLTVTTLNNNAIHFDVVLETMRCTSIGELHPKDHVNLEASMKLGNRLGGHWVQGHIDGTGTVKSAQLLADGSTLIFISADPSTLHFIVRKGSITVDGVSLTVVDVNETSFSFAMIPHTTRHTILGLKKIGDKVNVEVDLIAKYIEKFIGVKAS